MFDNSAALDKDERISRWSQARRASALAEWRRVHNRPEPLPFSGSVCSLYRADWQAVTRSVTELEGAQAWEFFSKLPVDLQADVTIEEELTDRVVASRESDALAWTRPFRGTKPAGYKLDLIGKHGPADVFGMLFVPAQVMKPALRAVVLDIVREHGVDGAALAVKRDPALYARVRSAMGVRTPISPRPTEHRAHTLHAQAPDGPHGLSTAEFERCRERGWAPEDYAASKARVAASSPRAPSMGRVPAATLPAVEGLTETEVARCAAKGLDPHEYAASKARLLAQRER